MSVQSMLRRVSKLEKAAGIGAEMDIQAMRTELTDARDQLAVGRKLVEQSQAKVRSSANLVRAEIRKVQDARNALGAQPLEYAVLTQRLRDLNDLNVGIGE